MKWRGHFTVAAGPAERKTSSFGDGPRVALIDEIKRQLQSDMGLLPVSLIRQRRNSFVELKAYDESGASSYSTAGYLGDGYFITVKHGVLDLTTGEGQARRITSVTINYKGNELPVQVIDRGNADAEVHPGDWAIVKSRRPLDLPALTVDLDYPYQFADPILSAWQ